MGRRRSMTAGLLALSIIKFRQRNHGDLPTSFSELNLQETLQTFEKVPPGVGDVTAFHFVPQKSYTPESASGLLVLEAHGYQSPPSWHDWLSPTSRNVVIQIYGDGTVRQAPL